VLISAVEMSTGRAGRRSGKKLFGGTTGCKAKRTSITKLSEENKSRIGAL